MLARDQAACVLNKFRILVAALCRAQSSGTSSDGKVRQARWNRLIESRSLQRNTVDDGHSPGSRSVPKVCADGASRTVGQIIEECGQRLPRRVSSDRIRCASPARTAGRRQRDAVAFIGLQSSRVYANQGLPTSAGLETGAHLEHEAHHCWMVTPAENAVPQFWPSRWCKYLPRSTRRMRSAPPAPRHSR
jgi:hypothetical protein